MQTLTIQYLQIFIDICKKINSSLEIGAVLSSITESTASALHVKGCAIFLLDRKSKRLRIGSSYGLSDAYINKGAVDSEKSIVDTLNGEWVMVHDAKNDQRVQYRDEAGQEGIESILSLPMSVKGTIIGVLRIYTSQPRHFSEIENEFISGLAQIGSIGIENARIHDHLKAEHEKLIYDVHQWFDFGASAGAHA
ncbi:MAG: GAF domain-containing protein [Desulfobacteraceae bacterium]|jgi:signal transduction protein with GAF and PtsI domain